VYELDKPTYNIIISTHNFENNTYFTPDNGDSNFTRWSIYSFYEI